MGSARLGARRPLLAKKGEALLFDYTAAPIHEEDLVRVRRQLHMYPELGWELTRTSALVQAELKQAGVPFEADKYGKNSVVATINPDKTDFTIGIRGDMDALPILEADHGQPYRSKNDGVMHACGHDTHTAMLLETAKALYAIKDRLACRVKLLFQPCEESKPSGARTMCEHGVMDDIDCIIMCHVNCNDPCGAPSCRVGVTNATSSRFSIVTHGESVHVAAPHRGKDALAMGVKIYLGIQMLLSRELDPFDPCVIGVCTMNAGATVAVNADRCEMTGSIRCFKDETRQWARARIDSLCAAVCGEMGGTYTFDMPADALPCAVNDERMYNAFVKSSEYVLGANAVLPLLPSPGGEDFAYYEQKKPGLLFGLGLRNDEKGFNRPAHTKDWDVDERGMLNGVRLFVQFVIDNMHGVPGIKG